MGDILNRISLAIGTFIDEVNYNYMVDVSDCEVGKKYLVGRNNYSYADYCAMFFTRSTTRNYTTEDFIAEGTFYWGLLTLPAKYRRVIEGKEPK